MRSETHDPLRNRWPHRLAVLLAAITFPLIWVGGLVTTYDAGMAVPDWPGTYGYNMFAYPWQTWISGPWDLFIEHGHRLLGSLAGLVTIALVAAVYRWDRRRNVFAFAILLLVAICLQGSLGGARVLLDERQLAMLHGCLGPAFYGLCVAMVVVTSRVWSDPAAVVRTDRAGWLHGLAWSVLGTAYAQLLLGALLRHISATASFRFFGWTVYGHLVGAGALLVLSVMLLYVLRKTQPPVPPLDWPARLLAVLIPLQILLGCGTWVANYYFPGWVPDWEFTSWYAIIEAEGLLQTTLVTAHQASGTLVLGVAVWLVARTVRLAQPVPSPASKTVVAA